MPDPWKIEPESKVWMPKSMDEQQDEKFRKELTRMAEMNKVGVMIVTYVRFSDPKKVNTMIVGQPSAKFLDAAWQRLRLFASDLITKGKVR